MSIINQDRFKLNVGAKVNRFILAYAEDIPRIENERQGVEVKIFLDPDGKIYFIPIDELNNIEVLDSSIDFII